MPSILFICTANRYRSPIAEACFIAEMNKNQEKNQAWDISSAGTWTENGLPAIQDAIQKAQLLGLDIQEHRSRIVTAELLKNTDMVIVMEQGQKEALQNEFLQDAEKIFLLSEVTVGLAYDIPDPVIKKDVGDIPKEICDLIHRYYAKIVEIVMVRTDAL